MAAARSRTNSNRSSRTVTRAGKSGSKAKPALSKRTAMVWTSLLGAMTVVGGGLILLNGGPGSTGQGMSIPPLMALAGPSTVEGVFNTTQPIQAGRWQAIVIHHSGSPVGTPASLDAQARAMNLKGLGYHFVLGNGKGMDDGEIHLGSRWMHQNPGAHAAGKDADWFNLNSIGICVVSDGDRQKPTPAQMQRLAQLTAALARELKIPAERIYLHRDIAQTTSPGRLFPEQEFRATVNAALAR